MNHLARGMLIAVAVCASPAFAQQEMGRLFFTPEKRDLLDRQRELNTLANQPVAEEPQLYINGQIRRSTGKRTTWINGQPQFDGDASSGVVARPSPRGADRVILDAGGEPASTVRVGESFNRSTHETTDSLGDGKIVINPVPPRR